MRLNSGFLRTAAIFNLCVSLLPSVLILVFVAQAAWVRGTLGHWPVVYRDDATVVVAGWLDRVTSWGVLAVLYSVPVWLISLAAPWKSGGRLWLIRHSSLFLGAIAILLVVDVLNPFGFPEWWLD